MTNSLRNRFPIKTREEMEKLLEEFGEYMKNHMMAEKTGSPDPKKFRPDSVNHRVRGAELFVDFLSGEPIKKK